MTHPDEGRLNELVDEELPAEERVRVSEHLEGCPSCREIVSGLRALRAEAALLAREVPADPALWIGIEAKIRGSTPQRPTPPAPQLRPEAGRPAPRAPSRIPLLRAAAFALLLGVSAGGAYFLSRTGTDVDSDGPVMSGPAGVDGIEIPSGTPASVHAIVDAYGPALGELEAILEEGRTRLQPETVTVLEENLRIIDEAIREVMEALAADPAHPGGIGSLNGMYGLRIQLMRQAVDLAREA